LAESWDVSSDGLVYTFYLRKGVKFHDGAECTAEDVKFTFDKIIEPESDSPYRSLFQSVRELKVIDKYTLQITLDKPSVFFIYRLTKEIVPGHLLEKADLKDCLFNFHPVGTGPFRFKYWTKEDEIVLEYNPDYYEGRPYLDNIIIKTYPDSRDMWTALMRGEVDFALFIEREDYEVVKSDPSFKAYAVPLDCYYALVYDLDEPMLVDKRIREAIACGIDRKSLIERVSGGYGLECNGPFHPDSLGFNPQVLPYEYNPAKSRGLLARAGWKDINNNGILEKDGEELELKVLVDARNDVYKKIIMVIRQQLQEIGIKIRVILYSDDSGLSEEFLMKNKPQAQLTFLSAVNPDDIGEEWHSKKSKRVGKLWIYRNGEVDRLFESGEITRDKAKRRKIYQEIHRIIYHDQPACFLYFPFVFHAISAKFDNVNDFFTLNMPFYVMKGWHFKKEVESRE